jgi:ribosomal protein S17
MSKAVRRVLGTALVIAAVATGVGAVFGAVAAGGAFAGLAAGTAGAFFAKAFVTNLVLGGLAKALTKKPTSPSLTQRDQIVSVRQAVGPHQIIYGRIRVGGTIVFLESTNDNKFLHVVVAIAGHNINQFEKFYFNEEEITVTTLPFGILSALDGKVQIQLRFGSPTQTAFPSLVRESNGLWTNQHRLQGIACVYIRLEFDSDKFPNGVPNFSFLVRGKSVFDPRTNTTAYSANPALCLADYLNSQRYGLNAAYNTEIDNAALIAAANVCDENIPLAGGGTQKRYECHGVFETSQAPEDVINGILSSMAGKAVWSSGKWRIIPGVYYTPTITFDENDLRGGIRVQSLVSRRENFNSIKGVFASEENNYIQTDFPPIVSQAFIAQDSNEQVFQNIELPFTTNAIMAQRLAKIELLKARQQITVTMPMKLTGLKANVGDIVRINNTRMGWNAKNFEVVSINMALEVDLGVDLELREISTDVFDWATSEEQRFDPAPNTNLPNAFLVIPPGISLSDKLQIVNEQISSTLVVTVTGSTSFLDRYEVEARKLGDAQWINLGQATGNVFELPFVEDNFVYQVRARAINTLGVRSAFTTGQRQIVGQTAPPQNVTGFSVNIVGNEAHFRWNAVPDLDLSHYKIRYSSLTVGATYSNAIDLIPKISRPATFATAPAMTGTFFIKAYDKSGIASIQAAEIVTLVDSIEGLNVVELINEHPTFAGLKTNTAAPGGILVLDSAIDFDDKPGLFDDALGLFDGAGGNVSSFGEYEFADVVDLGNVYTSRVTAEIVVQRFDFVNTFDAAEGLFDDRPGLFDGDEQTFDDVNVEFYVAITDDDPNATPTWSDWRPFFVGDYTARGFKFKVALSSTDSQATPAVSVLSVEIDMPDRVTSGDDIASGTDAGGKLVTFNRAFKVAPALGIAAQNLQQGDFYEITTKTPSGFTIRFKNSSGTVVNRTFDYVAKGYGSLAI